MKVNKTSRSTDGTSFQGDTVKVSINKLVELFGEPSYNEKGQLETYIWDMIFKRSGGIVFTIYYWYRHIPITREEDVIWHIGAKDRQTSERAKNRINKILNK